ncbi:hypothetical protein BGZ76_007894, partial [Entomortierella beljakovae]
MGRVYLFLVPPKKVNSARLKPYTRKTQTMEAAPKKIPIKPKKPINLKIYCIVEGEGTPFSVNILSNKAVDDLKKAILPEITAPEGIKPKDLKLKLIKNGVTKKGLGKLSKNTPTLLDDELKKLHIYFPAKVDEARIHIIVQLPQQ